MNAAAIALGMQAEVWLLDQEVRKPRPQRPLTQVIADAVTWSINRRESGDGGNDVSGLMPVHPVGRCIRPGDASRWLSEDVDDARLEAAFLAMLTLGWDLPDSWSWAGTADSGACPVDPDLAVLALAGG